MGGEGFNLSVSLAVFKCIGSLLLATSAVVFECCERVTNYFSNKMAGKGDESQSDIAIMMEWAHYSHIAEDVMKTIIKDAYTSLQAVALLTEEDLTDLNATLPAKGQILGGQ